MSNQKRCSRCCTFLPVSMFGRHKQKSDGLRAWCKPCNCAAARQWSRDNPEKKAVAREAWAKSNPDALRAMKIAWQHKNIEARRPKQRANANKQTEKLSDSYVRSVLGIRKEQNIPELVELKRIQLKILRLLKEMK